MLQHFRQRVTFFLAGVILALLLGSNTAVSAENNLIAVTFDDLPCPNCASIEITEAVTAGLIRTLDGFRVPAIGFVNEGKLYTEGKPDDRKVGLLRQWLDHGLELGNHTFSHVFINQVTVEQYDSDIVKGETILRPLLKEYGKRLVFFRHPQLRTGPDSVYKARLDSAIASHGYRVAPVTIDNDEYIYAYCYKKAKAGGDTALMREIAADYLSYMDRVCVHYETQSKRLLGRNVRQILLLHANELNADYLGDLLKQLIGRKYRFISLDEALADSAYALPEVCLNRGVSWIERWMPGKGMKPEAAPEISEKVALLFKQYSK